MFVTLGERIRELIACPICKQPLRLAVDSARCSACGTAYGLGEVQTGTGVEPVWDFRVVQPSYCRPSGFGAWESTQAKYLRHDAKHRRDGEARLREERDRVRRVYLEEFALTGAILDVGGHQGRLRQYIRPEDLDQYVSIDPFINVFEGVALDHDLLGVFECLRSPCNFVSAFAEALPFKSQSFDWVHNRSVLDHVMDPFMAMKESFRVLKPTGHMLLMVSIADGIEPRSLLKAAAGAVRDSVRALRRRAPNHLYEWTHANLRRLIEDCSFDVVHEYWHTPDRPRVYCVSLRKARHESPDAC